ncbi:hypothetical protein KSS94_16630 [Pseudomonas fakonensis]|uniref:Uncharacterized protein n=1 Tax=Pseudomonas fakonensis TaxID=2842355 RepID=A0ABX8N1N1_9PSED|nr:hypothetical protein [Pseudomonas fakonensis]QXH49573.1 hypothetical protein KSS94_16630 [Pseudomonas fakonensis]
MSSDNDLTPWEDAVILAFRDMQWIRRQKANCADFWKVYKAGKAGKQDAIEIQLTLFCQQTTLPPPLLAKLDGHAETASGDTLTAINERFFLLEFKASKDKLYTEKNKFMRALMMFVSPASDATFVKLSRSGHFFIYPVFHSGPPQTQLGLLPVHDAQLKTQPYLDAMRGKELFTPCDEHKWQAPASAEEVLWDPVRGLSLEDMADYLHALCDAHSQSGSGTHPIKVVVTTASGMVWPVADLTQLKLLAQFFQTHANPTPNMPSQKAQLKNTVASFTAHLSSKKSSSNGLTKE